MEMPKQSLFYFSLNKQLNYRKAIVENILIK